DIDQRAAGQGELPVQHGRHRAVLVDQQILRVEVGVHQLPGTGHGVEQGGAFGGEPEKRVLFGGGQGVAGVSLAQAAFDKGGQVSGGLGAIRLNAARLGAVQLGAVQLGVVQLGAVRL